MSSAHSMNARKCVHAQRPYPNQAFAHGGMNQARSEEEVKRGRETGKTEAGEKKGSPTKQKHIGGTKTRPT